MFECGLRFRIIIAIFELEYSKSRFEPPNFELEAKNLMMVLGIPNHIFFGKGPKSIIFGPP